MDELLVEKVLIVVEHIPRGRVVSYGDIAGIVGIGPRQAGSVLRHHGSAVPWWRVTSHAGDHIAEIRERAHEHWAEEGILVKPNGLGCRICDYRADLSQLAEDYEQALAETLRHADEDS